MDDSAWREECLVCFALRGSNDGVESETLVLSRLFGGAFKLQCVRLAYIMASQKMARRHLPSGWTTPLRSLAK